METRAEELRGVVQGQGKEMQRAILDQGQRTEEKRTTVSHMAKTTASIDVGKPRHPDCLGARQQISSLRSAIPEAGDNHHGRGHGWRWKARRSDCLDSRG